MDMYPTVRHTDFRYAAKALLETNLADDNLFCSITRLNNIARSVAEAYVSNTNPSGNEFNDKTTFKPILTHTEVYICFNDD